MQKIWVMWYVLIVNCANRTIMSCFISSFCLFKNRFFVANFKHCFLIVGRGGLHPSFLHGLSWSCSGQTSTKFPIESSEISAVSSFFVSRGYGWFPFLNMFSVSFHLSHAADVLSIHLPISTRFIRIISLSSPCSPLVPEADSAATTTSFWTPRGCIVQLLGADIYSF